MKISTDLPFRFIVITINRRNSSTPLGPTRTPLFDGEKYMGDWIVQIQEFCFEI